MQQRAGCKGRGQQVTEAAACAHVLCMLFFHLAFCNFLLVACLLVQSGLYLRLVQMVAEIKLGLFKAVSIPI